MFLEEEQIEDYSVMTVGAEVLIANSADLDGNII